MMPSVAADSHGS